MAQTNAELISCNYRVLESCLCVISLSLSLKLKGNKRALDQFKLLPRRKIIHVTQV